MESTIKTVHKETGKRKKEGKGRWFHRDPAALD
jgi:hypothetical protein